MIKEITEDFIRTEYIENQRSFSDIAEQLGTYTNKVVRAAKKLGIQPRDKSQAQKLALESGRHDHPTKGKERGSEKDVTSRGGVPINLDGTFTQGWGEVFDGRRGEL